MKDKVLITTRLTPSAVAPRGQFLQGCHEEELKAMQKDDAVAFFYAQGIRGTHAEIESACEPYGYHPLSLRILAGLIVNDRQTRGDIAVAKNLDVSDDIIQNKHHVLKVAYNTLLSKQQKLLGIIAYFRAPMNYDALKSIFGNSDIEHDLKTLETRGFLHWDRKTDKYDLHPIVRHYAYERLTTYDRAAAHSRLRDYFAAVDVPKQVKTLDGLAPILELYHHTLQAGELDKAHELFRDRLYDTLFYQLGAYETIIELMRAIFLDGEDSPPRLRDESAQVSSLIILANAYSLIGQPRRSVPLTEQYNKLQQKANDRRNLSEGLGNLANSQLRIGNLRKAESNLQRRIDVEKEIKGKLQEGHGHCMLGEVLLYWGEWGESKKELDGAISIYKKENYLIGSSISFSYKALCELLMVREGSSLKIHLKHSEQAFKFATEWAKTQYPVEREFIRAHWLLGASYRLDGQLDLAEHHLSEALTRDRAINMVDTEANILLDLARLRYDQKNYKEAKSLAEEALTITERCGYVLQGADVNLFLAQYALEPGKDDAKAKRYAQTALKLAHCNDGPPYHYKVAYEEAERMLENLGQ